MIKNKLYTANKFNLQLFNNGAYSPLIPYQPYNSKDLGGALQSLQSKLGGVMGGSKLAGSPMGGIIGGLGTAVGGLGNKLLSNGLNSGAGNAITGVTGTVGGLVSEVNPLLGGMISVGGGLIGGLTNRAFGSKINSLFVDSTKANNQQMVSQVFDDSSNQSVLDLFGNINLGSEFSKSDVGRDGWFSNKAKNTFQNLLNQQNNARLAALNSYNNAAMNADQSMDENLMRNYVDTAAYGGFLDNVYSQGGGIHINPDNKGKFNATKKRTGKTTEELTHSSNPLTRKRAIFALNAAKWNHAYGGNLFDNGGAKMAFLDNFAENPIGAVMQYNASKQAALELAEAEAAQKEQQLAFTKSQLQLTDLATQIQGLQSLLNSNQLRMNSLLDYVDNIPLYQSQNSQLVNGEDNSYNGPINWSLDDMKTSGYKYTGGLYKSRKQFLHNSYNNWLNTINRDPHFKGDAEATAMRLAAQDAWESNYGMSNLSRYNNYGGIKNLNGQYTHYDNAQQYYEDKYSRLNRKWPLAISALSDEQFINGLIPKGGPHYFTDDPSHYYNGFMSIKKGITGLLNSDSREAGKKALNSKTTTIGRPDRDINAEHQRIYKNLQEQQMSDKLAAMRTNMYQQYKPNSKFAFGGELGTNGTDFTNGIIEINTGGTHELNPNQGVLMGIDSKGTPNKVEEGEVVFNDYVFSNRLKVPKDFSKQYKLGGQMTFADAAKSMAKESEERPNDPISLAGLLASLGNLQAVLEDERFKKSMRDPLQRQLMMQAMQQLAILEQLAQQQLQLPQEAQLPSDEQLAMQLQMQPLMQAYGGYINPFAWGGNLFDGGGGFWDYSKGLLIPMEAPQAVLNETKAAGNNYSDLLRNWIEENNYSNFPLYNLYSRLNPKRGTNYSFRVDNPKDINSGRNPRYNTNKFEYYDYDKGAYNKDYLNFVNNGITDDMFNAVNQYAPDYIGRKLKNKAEFAKLASDISKDNKHGGYGWIHRVAGDLYNMAGNKGNTGTLNAQSITGVPVSPYEDLIKLKAPTIDMKKVGADLLNKAQTQNTPKPYQTWMRYAPIVGLGAMAFSDLMGWTNKPDYAAANAVLNASKNAGRYMPIGYNPSGNYVRTYIPDLNYQTNILNALALSTRNAIINNSNGNGAMANAGLLAADYNAQNALGNAYNQAELNAHNQRMASTEFNNKVDYQNSMGELEASRSNQDAFSRAVLALLSGVGDYARLRQAADQQAAAARSANLSGFLTNLGNLGRENFALNQINSDKAWDYWMKNNGESGHKNIEACGGKLNIRKKNNRRNK